MKILGRFGDKGHQISVSSGGVLRFYGDGDDRGMVALVVEEGDGDISKSHENPQ